MAPPTHRCLCTVHKCKNLKDDEGNAGAMVDARTFRAHQQDEKNAVMRKLASESRAAVLLAQESSLSSALEELSVMDTALTPGITRALPEEERYRIDKIRKQVSHVSDIKDKLARLREEVQSIGLAPTGRVADYAITQTLKDLSALRSAAVDLNRRLSSIARRSKAQSVVSLRDETEAEFKDFYEFIGAIELSWGGLLESRNTQRESDLGNGATEYDSVHHFNMIMGDARPILQLVNFMVVACHVILGLSRQGCYWLFSMIQFIIQTVVFKALGRNAISTYFVGILHGFPRDIRTVTSHFNLDAKATIYAACPKCHATYKPTLEGTIPVYQERCNFRRHGSRCGELVVRPKEIHGHMVNVPIISYVAFDFKDWVAGLLARPGYEEMMDGAWERMSLSSDEQLKDIFQGSTIRDFKGPDKQTHFSLAGGEGTGRYLFSLSFDSFNPLRNMAGGKKWSVGMFSLVCINLPIELRYEPENMFLAGIVPGPHEPPLDTINHYLRPIVDAFLEFWNGVRFTRTFLYELGRLIMCAIILVVCDSPAARKVGGFASFGQDKFCTFCHCNRTEHGYGNTNIGSWKYRTNEECRTFAECFRDATSAKAAARTFDRTGLRWSELLRLPYYDPTRFLVVDPMHNLFLGLIKEHFQGILGYQKGSPHSEASPTVDLGIVVTDTPKNPLPSAKAPRASVRRLVSWLEQRIAFVDQDAFDKMATEWGKSNVHVASFVYVGRLVGCLSSTMGSDGIDTALPFPKKASKTDLARAVLAWRRHKNPNTEPEMDLHDNPQHGSVFTTEEMEALWNDLENIVKPTWVTSVPTTLSSAGPKLKSDQWRTVGSLYLPITLIRLWSTVDPEDEQSIRRRELLHLTMLLLSAIAVASSRVTSANNAAEFLSLMLEYINELKRLFPDYKFHSIHHMATHIGEFLLMYGPVHGWWAFPFERMIGTLQRISTNHKLGELEETIGRSWHYKSNFRAFLAKASCPEAIKHCITMFETLVRPQSDNSLAADSYAFQSGLSASSYPEDDDDFGSYVGSEVTVTPNLRALFRDVASPGSLSIPQSAQSFTHIRHRKTAYSTRKRHEGNSGVLFEGNGTPYCIEHILQFPESKSRRALEGTWVIARPHQRANVATDPYLAYPRLRMKIWKAELDLQHVAMPILAISSHFAKRDIRWEDNQVAVVVSLSRCDKLEWWSVVLKAALREMYSSDRTY